MSWNDELYGPFDFVAAYQRLANHEPPCDLRDVVFRMELKSTMFSALRRYLVNRKEKPPGESAPEGG